MRYIQQRKRAVALVLLISAGLASTACPLGSRPKPSDIVAAENKLNQVANTLNAMAKTNRELYRKNVINKAERQKVATVVSRTNYTVDRIVDRAHEIDLTAGGSVALGKLDIGKLLDEIITELNGLGVGVNQEIRLSAQAAIALVQETRALVNAIKVVTK